MSKRLMIMAGGTGGHVFPGLAVADYLAIRGWQIHWLGTRDRMEARLVPQAGYPISYLTISGVRGHGLLRKLGAPFAILRAIWQAARAQRTFKPDVVLGMGGFASGPGGIAAWLRGTPLVIHEQNAVPGMTNKLLSRLAKKVLTGFDQTFSGPPEEKFQWVGNPVRQTIFEIQRQPIGDRPIRLLIIGGSLGAQALNEKLPVALASFSGIEVRHQCGGGRKAQVSAEYQRRMSAGVVWQVEEFIQDMTSAYAWADLIICRAGALTVAEVAASGLAAVFVPLPHAVDDHQSRNAQILVDGGAAIMAPQSSLATEEFKLRIQQLLERPDDLLKMGAAAREMARPDATAQVAECCKQMTELQA